MAVQSNIVPNVGTSTPMEFVIVNRGILLIYNDILILGEHEFYWHKPFPFARESFRFCKLCGERISNMDRYIEAYKHIWNNAFTGLLWFCPDCGKKLAEKLNKQIKEK